MYRDINDAVTATEAAIKGAPKWFEMSAQKASIQTVAPTLHQNPVLFVQPNRIAFVGE